MLEQAWLTDSALAIPGTLRRSCPNACNEESALGSQRMHENVHPPIDETSRYYASINTQIR